VDTAPRPTAPSRSASEPPTFVVDRWVRGDDPLRAVVEGGRARVRAIVMPDAALGVLPTALALAKGGDPSAPLRRVVLGGLPSPFAGALEMVGGALGILGAATRLAAAPLAVVMRIALATAKWLALRLGGRWRAAHDRRAVLSMLLSAAYLMTVGAGQWSVDANLRRPEA
jgi:uncharacterized membrane protein YphA (DoxX/SURF4 family)